MARADIESKVAWCIDGDATNIDLQLRQQFILMQQGVDASATSQSTYYTATALSIERVDQQRRAVA